MPHLIVLSYCPGKNLQHNVEERWNEQASSFTLILKRESFAYIFQCLSSISEGKYLTSIPKTVKVTKNKVSETHSQQPKVV